MAITSNNVNKFLNLLDEIILGETENSNTLIELLNFKLITLKLYPQSKKINFNPSMLLINQSIDFDLVIEIFKISFKISLDFLEALISISKFVKDYQINGIDKSIKLLKLLTIDILNQDNVTEIFNCLSSTLITNILLETLCEFPELKGMAYEIIVVFIKHLKDNDNKINLINFLLKYSLEKNTLEIFSAVLKHINLQELYNQPKCLYSQESFWKFIQFNISASQSYLQKQSVYILSKHIESCDNKVLKPLFILSDNSMNKKSWTEFFLLINIGREKQLHLVEPSLEHFKYIEDLPFFWKLCCYKIYLEHSQSVIVYKVAIYLLKIDFLEDELSEIVKLIFRAINRYEYSTLSCEMFDYLKKFFSKLNSIDFDKILEELLKISWNPISFWKTIQCFSSFIGSVKIERIQPLFRYITSLPHVSIRNNCIYFLSKFFWDSNNYSIIFTITSLIISLNFSCSQYLTDLKISRAVYNEIVKNFVESKNEIDIFVNYSLSIIGNINIWDRLGYNLNFDNLNCHAKLYLYNSVKWEISENDIKSYSNFLLTYFRENLTERTINCYVELFKLYALKDIYAEIFNNLDNELKMLVGLKLMQNLNDTNYVVKFIENDKDNVGFNVSIYSSSYCIKPQNENLCNECIELFIIQISKTNPYNFHKSIEDLLKIVEIMIATQSNEILYNIYNSIFKLWFRMDLRGKNIIRTFALEKLYKNFMHLKKSSLYKDIAEIFIEIIYSEELNLLLKEIKTITQDLLNIGEFESQIRTKLITTLTTNRFWPLISEKLDLGWVIIDLYLQGMIITKDERTEFNLCEEFNEDNSLFMPNLDHFKARWSIFEALREIPLSNERLLYNLIIKYNLHFQKRYFPDSKIHYEKLRIVQLILYITIKHRVQTDYLKFFAIKCLTEETNQNCVRQILTWILILVLQNNVKSAITWLQDEIIALAPAAIINLISVYYHLADKAHKRDQIILLETIFPYMMESNFKLRFYSKFLVLRLMKLIGKESLGFGFSQIQPFGDEKQIQINMKNDLYFLKTFNPFSLETEAADAIGLFYLPKLHKVNLAEWIHFKEYVKVDAIIPEDSSVNDQTETTEADKDENSITNIQQKIIPWKCNLEQLESENPKNFILILSLIEKAYNLGGLARTAEVFGVRHLVLNDAAIISNKEFQSLSMSSENWINPIQVNVKELEEYLKKLKKDGFKIIAAEQTFESQQLNKFSFPEKVALILGNEKSGIPHHLIPLMDVCLEIPQYGQTRSLNVHVAGATFIWEYTKQHINLKN